jgi:uncharacterized membrane protein YqiK
MLGVPEIRECKWHSDSVWRIRNIGSATAKYVAHGVLHRIVKENHMPMSSERVDTAQAEERANRAKAIELIKASEQAERSAIGITVSAKAEREAAEDRANAVLVEARASSEAEKITADGTAARYKAEAEGKLALNKAENELSEGVIGLRLREALLSALPAIIEKATEPMKHIDSIRVIDVNGLNGGGGQGGDNGDGSAVSGQSLPDQVVSAALRHRTAAPVLDSLMKEVGFSGGSVAGLLEGVKEAAAASSPANPEVLPPRPRRTQAAAVSPE